MEISQTNRMEQSNIIIIGAGMVGLSLAHQLLKKNHKTSTNIIILDKENAIGLHSSGRNSGVLHAGLYYQPGTLKSKVCVSGARRLKDWVKSRNIAINECGKVIVPQDVDLDYQLDVLYDRGTKNGAEVDFLDESDLRKKVPGCYSHSGRALWSKNTAVVNSKLVVTTLANELKESGVKFIFDQKEYVIDVERREILLDDSTKLSYQYLFNCAGLQADKVADLFDVGKSFAMIPFKGTYMKLNSSTINVTTNVYPVPDLDLPFLGVHMTPSADNSEIFVGPTAFLAFGRENYYDLDSIDLMFTMKNVSILINQYLRDNGKFRSYVNRQAVLAAPFIFLKEIQKIFPALTMNDLAPSRKCGIRPQLFNIDKKQLENDFICVNADHSLHVLNAISPAFTASFELADLIISRSPFNEK